MLWQLTCSMSFLWGTPKPGNCEPPPPLEIRGWTRNFSKSHGSYIGRVLPYISFIFLHISFIIPSYFFIFSSYFFIFPSYILHSSFTFLQYILRISSYILHNSFIFSSYFFITLHISSYFLRISLYLTCFNSLFSPSPLPLPLDDVCRPL